MFLYLCGTEISKKMHVFILKKSCVQLLAKKDQ